MSRFKLKDISFQIFSFSLLLMACLLIVVFLENAGTQKVSGQVLEEDGKTPIPSALVSVRAQGLQTITDQSGLFKIRIPKSVENAEITAWAPGYYIASDHPQTETQDIKFILRPLPEQDNVEYEWIDPSPESSEDACAQCHPTIYPQWANNAHGGAISNERFYSFYQGSDIAGNLTQLTGYLVDFPGTAGNCATCHAPGAAVDAPFTTNMDDIQNDVTAGIHCDFCHKVGKVFLNPADLQVYENVPGVLAMSLLRPPKGDQIFIGPYPDIHDPDTYNPALSESEFCATCHQFSFWGTPIYNSYGEWLASDYAQEGTTCQDCHMPPSGDTFFALQEQGGLAHPAEDIPSHFQLGLKDTEFMQTTLELTIETHIKQDKLIILVTIKNVGAGHHVPTDFPGRHLILTVQVTNEDGTQPELVNGPRIPEWVGDFSGKPGTVYAKVLKDALTGEFPVVNYWNPTLIHVDNRIAANQSQQEAFTFDMDERPAEVKVQVLFRRLFQPIAEIYGWDLTEIIMAEEILSIKP